jgi:hypothetical protein
MGKWELGAKKRQSGRSLGFGGGPGSAGFWSLVNLLGSMLPALCSACGGDGTSTPRRDPVPCSSVTLPDTGQVEEFKAADATPTGAGGPLQDGEYGLSAHIRYRAIQDGETASVMRAALRLSGAGSVMDYGYVESEPGEVEEPDGFSARVTAHEQRLTLAISCPEQKTSEVSYTASANALSIFEGNEELRFQRR